MNRTFFAAVRQTSGELLRHLVTAAGSAHGLDFAMEAARAWPSDYGGAAAGGGGGGVPACQPALRDTKPTFPALLRRRGSRPPLYGMLRVARRAACLLDVLFDHRDHRVIRHATLTRTVVVQDVTETQPALLHVISPESGPVVGAGKTVVQVDAVYQTLSR